MKFVLPSLALFALVATTVSADATRWDTARDVIEPTVGVVGGGSLAHYGTGQLIDKVLPTKAENAYAQKSLDAIHNNKAIVKGAAAVGGSVAGYFLARRDKRGSGYHPEDGISYAASRTSDASKRIYRDSKKYSAAKYNASKQSVQRAYGSSAAWTQRQKLKCSEIIKKTGEKIHVCMVKADADKDLSPAESIAEAVNEATPAAE